MRSGRQIVEYLVITMVAAALTGAIIAWGLDVLGLVPFYVLATIITLNDFIAAAILGPPDLYFIYPIARDNKFLYSAILDDRELPMVPPYRQTVAAYGLSVLAVLWLLVGISISIVVQHVPLEALSLARGPSAATGSVPLLAIGSVAFVLVLLFSAISGERISTQSYADGTTDVKPDGEP